MEATTGQAATNGAPKESKRTRSPSYPSAALPDVIAHTQAIRENEGVGWANRDVVIGHFGLSPNGSTGLRALAAQLHYGLLEEEGTGKARQFRLSTLGRDLVMNPDEQARRQAIRRAALSPRIYSLLWEEWGGRFPSEAQMEFDLEAKHGFNRSAIAGFIEDFKTTISFAGLDQSNVNSDSNTSDSPERELSTGKATGDLFASTAEEPKRSLSEAPTMPVAQNDAAVRALDIPIQLVSSDLQATLRIPNRMSEADFQVLKAVIAANLDAMKPGLVKEAATVPKETEPDAS